HRPRHGRRHGRHVRQRAAHPAGRHDHAQGVLAARPAHPAPAPQAEDAPVQPDGHRRDPPGLDAGPGAAAPPPLPPQTARPPAAHEAGDAVLGYVLALDAQIQVASIIKRRDTRGVVYRTPIEERHTELRDDMRRDIIVSLGGLAAEEIWFGDTTGGPASDL